MFLQHWFDAAIVFKNNYYQEKLIVNFLQPVGHEKLLAEKWVMPSGLCYEAKALY